MIRFINADPDKLKYNKQEKISSEEHTQAYRKLKNLYVKHILLPSIIALVAIVAACITLSFLDAGFAIKAIAVVSIFALAGFYVMKKLPLIFKEVPEFNDFISGKSKPANIRLNEFLKDKTIYEVKHKNKYVDNKVLRVTDTIICKDELGNQSVFAFDESEWTYYTTSKDEPVVDLGEMIIFCPEVHEE